MASHFIGRLSGQEELMSKSRYVEVRNTTNVRVAINPHYIKYMEDVGGQTTDVHLGSGELVRVKLSYEAAIKEFSADGEHEHYSESGAKPVSKTNPTIDGDINFE
jgi:hypothetical protein